MKEPISIKEILAVVIKRGRAILCTALAFAVLLGAVQLVRQLEEAGKPENSAQSIAERHQEALADYEAERLELEETLADTQLKLERQQEYNDNSVRMRIDPYNVYRSSLVFAITDVDENAFQQVYQQEGTPVDYIISKIQDQYLIFWDNADLATVLKHHPYMDLEEKYLQEISDLIQSDGGTISIITIGATKEDAEALRDAIFESIKEIQSTIEQTTYAHELTVITENTKVLINQELEDEQKSNLEEVETYTEQYKSYTAQLAGMQEPVPGAGYAMSTIVKSVLKWAIMGAVLGFLIACAVVWLLYILRDGVETSRQAEAVLGVPFFGSVTGRGGWWNRLACRFVGDRQWRDQEQAVQFIAANVKSRLDAPENIALITTRAIDEDDDRVRKVVKAMKDLGHTVVFVNRLEENPEIVTVMRDFRYAIMAESLGTSNRKAMLYALNLAKQLDAKILGFITV